MPARDPRLFDRTKPLVMARTAQLYEHDVEPGDPLEIVDEPSDAKGEITVDIAMRLWLSGQANYADAPEAVRVAAQMAAANPVVVEDLGGGWYAITAPWLAQPEKVQGKDAAEERRQAIADKGDTKGVTVEGGDGGWYTITAPWLDEPEKVQGQDAANARADALIAEGPPAGWRLLTDEEKAAKAEQEALLAQANRTAQEEVEKAAERDRQEAEEAARERAEAEAEAATAAADDSQLNTNPAPAFTINPTAGGWHEITGPGLDAPVKVQGADAAKDKAAELQAALPADSGTLTGTAATGTAEGDAIVAAAQAEIEERGAAIAAPVKATGEKASEAGE